MVQRPPVGALAASCLFLALVIAADLFTRRIPRRVRRGMLVLLWLIVAASTIEFIRNPHGWFAIGSVSFVCAPLLVIFGGAAAAVRRLYGWPDLGPLPGQVAIFACAILAGTAIGACM